MLKDTEHLKVDYELVRCGRYDGTTRNVFYPQIEMLAAYEAWATAYSGKRELEWDEWCDVRDGVPRGTNAKIRAVRSQNVMRH